MSGGASIFADCLNARGNRIESPTREDFERLVARMSSGEGLSFSIERSRDRDASLEVDSSGGLFSICGCEDSAIRGNFGFCLFERRYGDDPVEFDIHTLPKYCTTSDVETVIAVARTYFESGELERSVTWHVSRAGVFRPLAEISPAEVLQAGDDGDSMERHLAR